MTSTTTPQRTAIRQCLLDQRMTMSNDTSTSTTTPDNFTIALDRLLQDAREVRAAADLYEADDDVESGYGDEVAQVLGTMELDLTIARAALTARQAGTSEGLQDAVDQVIEAARHWLQDASVQAELGRMELRDRSDSLNHALDRARGEAARTVDRVGDAVGVDLNETRRAAVESISSIRHAVSDAVTSLRTRRTDTAG